MNNAPSRIETLDDRRVAAYLNLRERTLRGEQLFIAEGDLVVNRLLASDFEVESILVADRFLPRIAAPVADGVPVYLVEETLLQQIVGFPFYQGILAVGKRKTLPSAKETTDLLGRETTRLVVLPRTTKPDNLGLIFRSCAALEATAVLLGPQCCDPFSRRALRVSMGAVLQVPILLSSDIAGDLAFLKNSFQYETWGTVLEEDAEILPGISPNSRRVALLFGNEFDGLDDPAIAVCDRKVVIPMPPNVDSLNLGVSVGIFLYALKFSDFHKP